VDVLINKKLLKNISDAKKSESLDCNTETTTLNKSGDLTEYGMAWYYEDIIVNIISLSNWKKKYWLTYDDVTYDCFQVHKEDSNMQVCICPQIVFVTAVESNTNK